MRTNPCGLVAAVFITLTVGACADGPTSARAPRVPAVATTSAALPACDGASLDANARAYAASNTDPLITIVSDVATLVMYGHASAATDRAFDGLARLAAMRGTTAQAPAATGATFNAIATGLIGCMEDYVRQTVPADFTVAGALAPGWIFEVRGKAGTDPAAGAYERGSGDPYWGTEAPGGWSTSIAAGSQSKRFLVYGYRIPDFLANDPRIGSAFELRTIPAITPGVLTFAQPIIVGMCNVELTPTVRVQHVTTVLVKEELTGCSAAPPSLAHASPASAPARVLALASRALAWFAPQPLHAAFIAGTVGGAVSELSPSKVIDMVSVRLAFTGTVADGRISQPLAETRGGPITVFATTQGGTPLAGAAVTLTIAGNNSVIAFFRDGANVVSSVTRMTGADGAAVFAAPEVFLTKPGGYQLLVTGAFDDVDAVPVRSNKFNMKNK